MIEHRGNDDNLIWYKMYDITNDYLLFCELLRICPLFYIKTTISCSREKFVENLKMVEDIVVAAEDNTLERKSQDYTGFKRFLFGSLEALDINVSDYIGQLFSCK